ncbi:hypothetical protein Misp02_23620 [Microtetraspora sp. NBRC 16547]|nr:hypothetical protein Misp02_23620 [Microtetraspora sp. NBRC 16547]
MSTQLEEDADPANPDPLRRRPFQRRSARRVERMLDACAELLDEIGYEALTTTRIAERAGVAIGSVYQFFPDKRAITQALTQRHVELFVARVGRRFITEDYIGWWDAVDAIIEEYVEMHRSVPGFRSLHFGDIADLNLLDSVADTNGDRRTAPSAAAQGVRPRRQRRRTPPATGMRSMVTSPPPSNMAGTRSPSSTTLSSAAPGFHRSPRQLDRQDASALPRARPPPHKRDHPKSECRGADCLQTMINLD